MQKLVWQNANGVELDLTSGNYGITEWEGFSNASLNIQQQQVPFQDGGVFLDALIEQRELSVTLAMQDNNNLELRYQQRRELISALNPKLGEGYLIYTNDFISKRIKCVPQIPVFETHNSDTVGTPKASLSWTACSPYWEDLEETSVLLFGGEQSNAVKNEGDVEIGAKIEIYADNIDNVTIKNLKQDKSITINDDYTGTILINTEAGQKAVQSRDKTSYNINSFSIGFYDICYSEQKKLFCAISSRYIAMSADTEEWFYFDTRTLASSINLFGVCYSVEKGLFCAVGNLNTGEGIAVISSDGKNWQLKMVGTTFGTDLRAVVYSEQKHLFIAVGHCIAISNDGTSWTIIQSNLQNLLTDICYSKKMGMFVAVGMNDTVATSSDGSTWNITTSGSLLEMFSITYSEQLELFCKSSYDGTIKTSTDATNWTTVTLPAISNWSRIRWCDGFRKFVVVGQSGSVEVSSDGITWINTGITTPSEYISQVQLTGICNSSNQGLGVIVGYNGGMAKTLNGINWEYVSFNISSYTNFNGIAYNSKEGFYIIIGDNGSVLKSYDKKIWQYFNLSMDIDFRKVIYSEKHNCFVATGATSSLSVKYILISTDGISWNVVYSVTGMEDTIQDICYSEEQDLFCACGKGIFVSNDLTNWTRYESGFEGWLYSIIYDNNLFVVCGEAIVYKSEDGEDWTDCEFPEEIQSLNDIIYIKELGKYLIAGTNIWTSVDLEVWKKVSGVQAQMGLSCAVYFNQDGIAMILGTNNYFSYDLENWYTADVIGNPKEAKVINNQLWICGSNALLEYSLPGGKINIINKISSDTDMTLGLEIGENTFVLSSSIGSVYGKMTFRQKYIGV